VRIDEAVSSGHNSNIPIGNSAAVSAPWSESKHNGDAQLKLRCERTSNLNLKNIMTPMCHSMHAPILVLH